MNKKIYIGLGVTIAALLVVGGIYWQLQRRAILPIESEVSFEEEAFNKDIAELKEFEEDKALENLEQDLNLLAGEVIETTSLENMEQELALEFDSFSDDLTDLAAFEGDTSLDNLESELSY